MSDNRKIYRVGELTRLIKTALEKTFGEVWVQGEVSNVRRPSSGHIYFTIKDESAQISAVMFRGSQGRLKAPADRRRAGRGVRVDKRVRAQRRIPDRSARAGRGGQRLAARRLRGAEEEAPGGRAL